jgi:hypothetical protein
VQEPQSYQARIVPAEATVTAGRVLTFSPDFGDGPTRGTAWRVLEPGGGTVTATGGYQAPANAGVYTLQARFAGPPEQTGTARITVVLPPRADISAPAIVMPGAVDQTATITPTPGGTYTWTLTGGLITQGQNSPTIGFEAGTGGKLVLHCRVTNAAGDAVNSSQDVTIAVPVALAIRPPQVTITEGRDMKFGFDLEGGASLGVTWSLGEPGCGQLDQAGHYVAPAVPGIYTVRITSRDDASKVAIAQVKVVRKPPEDIYAVESFRAGAQGLTARVGEVEGMTYAWTLEGGTITSGATARTVVFTAGEGARLILRCRITNGAGDSCLAVKTLNAL